MKWAKKSRKKVEKVEKQEKEEDAMAHDTDGNEVPYSERL